VRRAEPSPSAKEGLAVAVGFAALITAQLVLTGALGLFANAPWFDECLTLAVAGDPDLAHGLRALSNGADTHPPVPYLLLRVFAAPFGGVEAGAARLLSLTATWAALVLVQRILRRALPLWPAVAGALFVWATPLVLREAVNGRAYGLWMAAAAAFAASLVSSRHGSRPVAQGLAVAASAALLCSVHYLGILTLALIAAADLAADPRPLRTRLRGLAPALAGGIALLATLPILRGQQAAYEVSTWLPTLTASSGLLSLRVLLPDPWIMLLVMLPAAIQVAADRLRGDTVQRLEIGSLRDLAGLLSLCTMPLALVVFSLGFQPTYLARYAICAALGFGTIAALLVQRATWWRVGVPVAGLIVFSGLGLHGLAGEKRSWNASVQRMAAELPAIARGMPVIFEQMHDLLPLCRVTPTECASSYRGLDFERLPDPEMATYLVAERDAGRVLEREFGTPRLERLEEVERWDAFYFVAADSGGYSVGRWFPHHEAKRVKHTLFHLRRRGRG
jgi:hypothetical protein